MSWRRLKRVGAIGTAATLAFSIAACGDDGSEGERAEIDVGILPITSVGALMLGIEEGFFEEENLDVNTHVAQSGAALAPAVQSGQYQFAFSNNVSLIIAADQGLPLRVVRSANSADEDPTPSQESLVVAEDSDITSPEELEGATIAVNGLNNTPHLAVLTTLEDAGVDTSTVEFVEIGFPDMPLAVEQGRVDAADISEPFLTQAMSQGQEAIANPYREVEQDLHLSSWFTTQNYIDDESDVVARFARAVDKANEYARDNTDEIRDFIPSYIDVEEELAQEMALPRYPEGTVSPDTLGILADATAHFGFVESTPDTDGLIAQIDE